MSSAILLSSRATNWRSSRLADTIHTLISRLGGIT
jgi:hypothetical protein